MASAKRKYYAAVDGLRILAIVAVVVYHANPTLLPGGFAGVTLFFVITGYLLTSSIDRKLRDGGSFSYLDHLRRRVARLLPSMLALVGIVAVLCVIFARPLVPKMKDDVIPALLFFENWFYIVRNVSYFAAAGLPSPLTHLWYVALVMQFSIVWPIILVVMGRLGVPRRARVAVCAVLAVASQVLMAILYNPQADTNRVYYGLDTRAGELLVGALIAEVAPIINARRKTSRSERRKGAPERSSAPVVADGILTIAGLAGLAVFVAFCFLVNGYSPFPYYGGFLLLALASGALVLACIRETTPVARVLALPPFSALGKRSFALYLWHYPLLLIMNPATRTTDLTVVQHVLQVVAILAATEASYRIFEWPRTVTTSSRRSGPTTTTVIGFPAVSRVLGVAGIIGALVLFITPSAPQQTAEPEESLVSRIEAGAESESDATEGKTIERSREREFFPVEGTIFQGTPFESSINIINSFTFYQVDEETGVCNAPVILVGDSVPLGAELQFNEMFPYGYMDAQVSRSIYAGREVLQSIWDSGIDGDCIVWALGNNGVCYEEEVRDLIAMCGDRRVYFVTARVPLALQDMNNELFYQVAADYDNVEVIDWYGWSAGHDDYFWDDGTHLRPEGAEAYCLMLRTAIAGR